MDKPQGREFSCFFFFFFVVVVVVVFICRILWVVLKPWEVFSVGVAIGC